MCSWPQEPFRGSVMSGRRHHDPVHIQQKLSQARRPQLKRRWDSTESATFALLGAVEIAIRSVPSPFKKGPSEKDPPVELGGDFVESQRAQLGPRRLHVCVATRRRAVCTRAVVSTATYSTVQKQSICHRSKPPKPWCTVAPTSRSLTVMLALTRGF